MSVCTHHDLIIAPLILLLTNLLTFLLTCFRIHWLHTGGSSTAVDIAEPWFDSECRAAKRKTRRLERLYRRRRRRRHDPAVRDDWKTQFQRQRRLFRCKAAEYWKTTIADCRDDVRLLWSKLSRLLEPSTSAQQLHTASDLATHFTTKVSKVRQSTVATAPQVIHERPSETLGHFIFR